MIRLIDKLILQAIAPPFLLAVTVLTSIVLIRELGILSELLIARNASLEVLSLITLSILPGILIFSLPMSFLIGNLIGLTGLSGESQIVAARACGIPLRRLLRPVMGLLRSNRSCNGSLYDIYLSAIDGYTACTKGTD